MSKEIEQNEHYTGKIAMSLDPSLVVKELDTGKDGLITKEAVRKQTSDPQEEIDQMKQTAKDDPGNGGQTPQRRKPRAREFRGRPSQEPRPRPKTLGKDDQRTCRKWYFGGADLCNFSGRPRGFLLQAGAA